LKNEKDGMMNEDRLFDEIALVLASPMPRRKALGRIFGGLAGAALTTIVWSGRALADPKTCKADSDCTTGSCCNKKICCGPTDLCCGSGANSLCCAAGGSCCGNGANTICCSNGEVCSGNGSHVVCKPPSPS